MSHTTRSSGRKKSSRSAWIIIVIVVVLAVAGIIVGIVVSSNQVGPTPTPTVSPTPSPTKTSTSTPTVTPTPSPTSSPTPSPSGSTSPSPSPTVNPTQAWANKTYGIFATVAWSHTGSAVVVLPKMVGEQVKGGILTFTNNAADDSDFVVQVLDQDGNPMGDPQIAVRGDYAGTVGYGLAAPEINSDAVPTTVRVTSSGNWAVEIAAVSAAPMGLGTYSGDKVILMPAPKNNTLVVNYGLVGGRFGVNYYYQDQLTQILVPLSGAQVDDQSFALNGVPGLIAVNSGGQWTVSAIN
ncbi:MAG: hypothetical protein K9H50_06290 [Aurantimicrobium sp.]|nr:hypothetical protein [Aurantimicrobium sp.]